jgi:hypothetical protein
MHQNQVEPMTWKGKIHYIYIYINMKKYKQVFVRHKLKKKTIIKSEKRLCINNVKLAKKIMHQQCKIILHCQLISIIFFATSLHFIPLSDITCQIYSFLLDNCVKLFYTVSVSPLNSYKNCANIFNFL